MSNCIKILALTSFLAGSSVLFAQSETAAEKLTRDAKMGNLSAPEKPSKSSYSRSNKISVGPTKNGLGEGVKFKQGKHSISITGKTKRGDRGGGVSYGRSFK